MNDFEQQWAVAMQKAKNRQKIPLSTQKDNLVDRIKDRKKTLLQAVKMKNKIQIQNLYKELVGLRAKLFVMRLRLAKEKHFVINEGTAEKHLLNYVKECKTLASALGAFLK